jgi:NADH dehydrogenase [ubiquinone] 1 alpha subcomplex assembly factor 5
MEIANQPFDRRLLKVRRDRAARTGAEADYLFRRAADELLERLASVTRGFGDALDLGSGTGRLADALRARGIAVTVAGDAEGRFPYSQQSFDLVVSVGALDSVNDLPGTLAQVRRALRPDGLFLATFVGAGSLPRLRRAMRAADEAEGAGASARIHPQIDVRAAGDLLTRGGFALPVADREIVEVRFSSLARLVGDLRAMGATNVIAGGARPVGRIGLAAAIADFAAGAGPDGKTAEMFEIVYLSGWAPGPDQPKPARRGSATASLADALKARR